MTSSPSQLGIGQVAPLGQGQPSSTPQPATAAPQAPSKPAAPAPQPVTRKAVQRPPRAAKPTPKNPIVVKKPRTVRVGGRRKAKKPDNGLSIFNEQPTQRFKLLRSLKKTLYGQPPARVVANRPPLASLAIWRWVYFWLYVTFRIYKANWLNWMPVPRPSPIHRLRRDHKRMEK
jgi:hypothetical protein